jgi:hypothetical protein
MNLQLIKWQAHWDDGDNVDLENRSTVTEAMKAYINGAITSDIFLLVVPFRIQGVNVASNGTYKSGFIRNICRLSVKGVEPAIFEAVTLDGDTLRLAANDMIQ